MGKDKKKVKRKPRENKIKHVDLLVPIDITQLGAENDPCFGKLHDPKAAECQRCGDCELCQVIMAQTMNLLRKGIEKKGKFRDIEEEEIYKGKEKERVKSPVLNIKKALRASIRKHKTIEGKVLISDIAATQNVPKAKVERILGKMLKVTDKFKLKNGKYVWKEK